MKKPRTSEQLAMAWKRGRLSNNTALRRHLQLVGIWPIDPGFFMFLPVLIGYANMGLMDKVIPVGDEQRTVGQTISDLQLDSFLEDAR